MWGGGILAQASYRLERSPGNHNSVVMVRDNWLKKKNSAGCHRKVSHLEFVALLVDLLLAGVDSASFRCIYVGTQGVKLSKVENSNCVQIILDQVHLLNELGDQLDHCI